MFLRKSSVTTNTHLAYCARYQHPACYLIALFMTLLPRLSIALAAGYTMIMNANEWISSVGEIVKTVIN